MEAIILVGGLGTRLRPVVGDVPKPLAPIQDRPFLDYLLWFLWLNGIKKVILAAGHKNEHFIEKYREGFKDLDIRFSIEEKPLGTGGAVKKALGLADGENVLVLNGDTFFAVNLRALIDLHKKNATDITMAIKSVKESERYGSIVLDGTGKVISMREKGSHGEALISGGIYLINKKNLNFDLEAFSFEEYLGVSLNNLKIMGYRSDSFFIDIGIQDDYKKTQKLLPNFSFFNDWTLFLDRDGVINEEIKNDYVRKWEDLKFIDKNVGFLRDFTNYFKRVYIVTNQQGVGKGLMTERDLQDIHSRMLQRLRKIGVKIDGINYCPDKEESNSDCRKPNTGMFREIKEKDSAVSFEKSITIGDSESDVMAAKRIGSIPVLLGGDKNHDDVLCVNELSDLLFT